MDMTPDIAARRSAGRAVRDLGHALVGHDAPPELLSEVGQSLAELTERVNAGARRKSDPSNYGDHSGAETASGLRLASYDDRPFSGLASPWGLDLEVHQRGNDVEGLVTLRAAHEGAPGRCHGGIVAALFDDVFGFILGVIGQAAFTGELTIRYERPAPLYRPIVCRGRLTEQSGRKLWIEGELVDITQPDQPVVARGKGLFITVDPAVFAETMQLPAPPAD